MNACFPFPPLDRSLAGRALAYFALALLLTAEMVASAAADEPAGRRPLLTLINGSAQPVDVYWLKSDSERVPNGSIVAGGQVGIGTTIGHRFLVVGREDGIEATVTAVVPVQAYRFQPETLASESTGTDPAAAAPDGIVTAPPTGMGIPSFYTKYISAQGYPIVASSRVNDYALKEAAYLVNLMLANRPDVREAMILSGSRMCLLAYDEFTTDLPEFQHLDSPHEMKHLAARDYWDARARGTGGSETDPHCSCGEENLLAYEGDPYAAENILIHELAHNIHLRGLLNVDPTFDQRLKQTYERAMARGLWKGKYASVNHYEYFAEGVQSWFDDNREDDHDHNHVNTRAELLEYDPDLAEFCREVFGDTVLKYTQPTTRLVDHLAGYDPTTAPRFAWPPRLKFAQEEIRRQAVARGTSGDEEASLESLDPPVWKPSGEEFRFWRNETQFSKTYYVDGRAPHASDENPGTAESPFKTINRAAEVLRPGECVRVRPGIYRECVRPARGGSSPRQMIGYYAEPGGDVIVKGSEPVGPAWTAVAETGPLWGMDLADIQFGDYHPFMLENLPAAAFDVMEWAEPLRGTLPYTLPRGMVFQGGRRLERVASRQELELTEGSHWTDRETGRLFVHTWERTDPNQELMEITTRRACFRPRIRGLGYIHVRGFVFEQVGNGFPRPQEGALSVCAGHHWLIEDNTVRQVNGIGIDIGSGWYGGALPPPEEGRGEPGWTIVRGNHVTDTGVCGIAGLPCSNSLIEGNILSRNTLYPIERMYECGGIKTHINHGTLIRRNWITDNSINGIWMDWDNRDSRCTQNVMIDCTTGIFVEASVVEPFCSIDRNVTWGGRQGIYEHDSRSQTFAQNLIGGAEAGIVLRGKITDRTVAKGHPVAGGGHTVNSNLFVRVTDPIRETPQPQFLPNQLVDNVIDPPGLAVQFNKDENSLTLRTTQPLAASCQQTRVSHDLLDRPWPAEEGSPGPLPFDGQVQRIVFAEGRFVSADIDDFGFRDVECEGTYSHHLQGICADRSAIYWCFTTQLIKTDMDGRRLAQVPVADHHGDLCHYEGKLYVAVNLGKFNDPLGNADSWVYVYRADDLSLESKHATPEVFHGAGGIGVRNGRFFVVGGLPDGMEENYVYEYDTEFQFIERHTIASGHTHLGIQTATFAQDRWWFGCYGDPKILLVTDADYRMIGRFEFDCSLGIEGLPDGRFLSATGRCIPNTGCTGRARKAVADEAHGLRYE